MKNKQLISVCMTDNILHRSDFQSNHSISSDEDPQGTSYSYSAHQSMASGRQRPEEPDAAGSPSSLPSWEDYLISTPHEHQELINTATPADDQVTHSPHHLSSGHVSHLDKDHMIRDCTSKLPSEAALSCPQSMPTLNPPHELSLEDEDEIKAAIISHPHYSLLVAAHINCQKVGAPPEVLSQMNDAIRKFQETKPSETSSIGADPELDQFMNTYCNMLLNYEQDMTKTFEEAMICCKKLETQLNIISSGAIASGESEERNDLGVTSNEDESGCEDLEIDPLAEEREIKEHLLRKYSGYIGSLKQEFSRKKKKGKLPCESRQLLLDWWCLHIKWPYPSESEKANLAASTGLDQKQINNWFINQRKRHWKPSEDTVAFAHPNQTNTHGGSNETS